MNSGKLENPKSPEAAEFAESMNYYSIGTKENHALMTEVNHELYGGLYAQLVFGESFEEPAGLDGVSCWAPRDAPSAGRDGNWPPARTWCARCTPQTSLSSLQNDE